MSLPEASIRRPVTVAMLCLGLALMGAIAVTRLPIELYPNYSFGDISIIVNIRGGMPPVEVENRVTKLIEESVSDVSHLKDVLSFSEEGKSQIVLSFEPGTDMDFAALEVREKFSRVRSKLPREIERPVIAKFDQEDFPVLVVAVTALGYTPEMLLRLVDEQVKDRVMRVQGVANVDVGGGRERKILVEVDLDKLQAFRLPIDRVTRLLNVSNLNLLAGEVDRTRNKVLIRAMGEFHSLDEIRNLGIAVTPSRSVLRVKDVATVKDSFLEATSYARVNTLPVVSLYIQKETTANTVEVAHKTLEVFHEMEKDPRLPKDLRFIVTVDQSVQIERAIEMVGSALVSGGVLAVLILGAFFSTHWLPRLLFIPLAVAVTAVAIATYRSSAIPVAATNAMMISLLALLLGTAFLWRHLRLTLTAAVAIPLATVVTFGFMFVLNLAGKPAGFLSLTLNIMTLGGLAIGVGMLLDNSIVVLDNIVKHLARGEPLRKACGAGASEMMLAITASTLTTTVAFLPIVFINKEIRLLYVGFSLTISFALVASLAVALSVVPLLASRLSFPLPAAPGRLGRGWHARYRQLVSFCLRGRWVLALACFFLCTAGALLYDKLPKEFLGTAESEDFTVFVELPSGAKLEVSDEAVAKIEKVLNDVPEIKTISSRIEKWSSKIYVKLVPLAQRSRSTKDVIESLRPPVDEVERSVREAFIYFEEPQEVSSNEVILEIYGWDYDVLSQIASDMAKQMQTVQGLTDVKIRWRRGRPEWQVRVDKVRAARFGLTVEDVAETLHAQMRGLRATLYHTEGKEVEVITRLEEADRSTLEKLKKITFTLPDRRVVSLDQVATLEIASGPSKIWRKNKQRMIQVSANRGRYAFGEAAKKVDEAVRRVRLPKDYYWKFGANYWKLLQNQNELTFAAVLSVLLIYLVLASLFESYWQPLLIMGILPLPFPNGLPLLYPFSLLKWDPSSLLGWNPGSFPLGIFFLPFGPLPLAYLGASAALYFSHQSVNVGALMGVLLLSGIDVNNGIILVDEVNRLKSAGARLKRALVASAVSRLRPISMTALTTIFGLVPLAFSRTEESSLWAPMALVVIGGLSLSTMMTAILLPALYLILEDIKDAWAFVIRFLSHSLHPRTVS